MQAEEVLQPEYVGIYKEHHQDIYTRMIRLNTSINILEKLFAFPFYLFISIKDMQFWYFVIANFQDISLLLFCGLITDKGSDVFTLKKFKGEILKNIKDEYLFDFKNCLNRFDDNFLVISRKAINFRNQFIAHRLLEKGTNKLTKYDEVVNISELRLLFQQTDNLFQLCSFGSGYGTVMLDFMHATIGGVPVQSHLDDIFDLIAKNSHFINQPEENPGYWNYSRDKMDPEQLEILNKYRRKFGMPEV